MEPVAEWTQMNYQSKISERFWMWMHQGRKSNGMQKIMDANDTLTDYQMSKAKQFT